MKLALVTQRGRSAARARLVRWLLIACAAGALSWMSLWIQGYPVPEDDLLLGRRDASALAGIDRMFIERLHAVEWNEGTAQWRIEAASASFSHSSGDLVFYDVTVVFAERSVGEVEVRGARGSVHALSPGERAPRFAIHDIEIAGGVVATTTDGIRVETERMVWDSEQDAFWIPEWARVTRGGRCQRGRDGYLFRNEGRFQFKMKQVTPCAENGEEARG